MVAETVRCAPEEAAPLARLVFEKCGGNPFFLIQLLTALHNGGLIALDRRARRWRWDVERISAHGYTDNVVELMAGKLRAMPPSAQEALRVAAALGAGSHAATLALVLGRDAEPLLRPAVEDGLLLCVEGTYRFSHDRIEEAAYSLAPEPERAALHLRIGRLLLAHTPPERLDVRIFELTHHLNRGAALITSREERERLAELNLRAGLRAKGSAAYASALPYLASGRALLAEDCWERRYELTFALELHRAECEYLENNLDFADALLDLIAEKARTPLDKARALQVRIHLYQLAGRYAESFAMLFDAAQLLGEKIPRQPEELPGATEEEFRQVRVNQGQRQARELLDLPLVNDPTHSMMIALLTESLASAYIAMPAYYSLLAARAVNLCILHGNSAWACHAYIAYALTLVARFRDMERSRHFAELALALSERLGDRVVRGVVLFVHGSFVNPWHCSFASGLPILERSFTACLDAGDPTHAAYPAEWYPWHMVEAGAPLDDVLKRAREFAEFTRRSHNEPVNAHIRLQELVIARLCGTELHDGEAETKLLEIMVRANYRARARFLVRRLEAAVIFGHREEALSCAAQAAQTLHPAMAELTVATHSFYYALALAALHDDLPAGGRAESVRKIERELQRLESWAQHCPENFADRAALVSAELARIEGRVGDAMQRYEQAICAARENGFVHHEALAWETAARFYRSRGLAFIADTYLREARVHYQRWGADGKVRQLDAQHPHLVVRQPLASATPTMALRPEQVDLMAVLKASQTISSVMVRDQLLQTLLEIVLEQGGARRARLFLSGSRGRELAAAVERSANSTQGQADLPQSILDYVERACERVILEDAGANPGRFSGDPYLRLARPRSVLCQPVLNQGRLVALLYLENDLVPGAFTPERLVALDLLAAQAAISLENARFFEETKALNVSLEQQIHERQRAEQALRASEERFRELVERAPEAILVFDDARGRFSSANAHAELLFGRSLDELTRLGPQDLFEGPQPDGRPSEESLREHTERALAGEAVVFERSLRDRRGREAVLEVRLARLPLGNGKQVRASFIDITERKRAEEQLRQGARRKDEFLAVLGHELRNPLAPILNASQILKLVGSPDPRAQRAREMIERQVGHISRMVDDLLDVARIVRGKISLRRERLDWVKLVRTTVSDLQPGLEARGMSFTLQLPPRPVFVSGDPTRLAQVLSNILQNAMKFSDQGGRITVELCPGVGGGPATLAVQDVGIGMTRETLEEVFSPFFQANVDLARSRGGMGMGLALVRGLVGLHGGTVNAESEGLGRGSRITVRLPEIEAPPAATAPAQESSARAAARSILIVEDNSDAARSLQLMLELMGHRVRVAADGASGVVEARSFRPEIVVCDIGLPGHMDGYAVARALRADPDLRTARLVALTGYGQEQDKRVAREAGFDVHLTKPADVALILQVLD